MSNKLTKLDHLRMALDLQKEQNALFAIAVAEAIEELAGKIVSMDQINAAIAAAVAETNAKEV